MPKTATPSSIDSYIADASPSAGKILKEIRRRVRKCVPDATETISYQMPALRIDRVFFYFAAFKEHIGVFPPVKGDAELMAALAPYVGENGNLRFRYADGMPYELIERVAMTLAAAHGRRSVVASGTRGVAVKGARRSK
jgi:uncharacterized protein YdhG (YjbR/CyaY superfamily)